jgi:hypothetical protein
LPEAASSAGITTSRMVPGSIVLRITTTGAPDGGAGLADLLADAAYILRSMPPLGGSACRRTPATGRCAHRLAASVVARRRPAATCSCPMISPMSFSMIGDFPALIRSTLPFPDRRR